MKKIFFLLAFFVMTKIISAQSVGIGTTTPNASAALEIKSSTKGLLIPVMNTTARNAIAAPANGLLVYDSTAKAFYFYKNTGWKSFAAINALTDADGNTTVEVERTLNDDIVRITTGGNDHTAFTKNATGANPVISYPLIASNNFLVGTNSGWNLKSGYSGNAFVGIQSGFRDSTGTNNTFVGNFSGYCVFTGSKNVAVGLNAGYNMANGSANVNIGMNAGWGTKNTTNSIHIGHESGYADSATDRNIAIGSHALYKNKSDGNIAIGAAALSANEAIYGGTIAIGDSALFKNITGVNNVAVGNKAMHNNTDGYWNIAMGPFSLFKNKSGYQNTAMGYMSMFSNKLGYNNTAIGFSALDSDTSGNENTAIGCGTLGGHGYENTAIGAYSQLQNQSSGWNTSLGVFSLNSNQLGNGNTAIGRGCLGGNRSGNSNVAVGINSLLNNSTGSNLVAIGDSALYRNIGGIQNTAVGSKSLLDNLTGSANTALGFESLFANNNGFSNTANGFNTLHNNTFGNNNTATGSQALSSNITGNSNTANGSQVLINNKGNQNTATGARALLLNTDGSGNVAEGFETLFTNTTGTQNIGIGYQAGSNGGGTTQFNYNSFCIFLGANANAFSNAGGNNGLLNSIAIGKLASVTASNQVRIGDNLITSIGGYAGWTNFSDGRYKKNINSNVPGLDFILQLKPVTYQLDIKGLNKHFNIKPDSTAALEKSRQQFIALKEQQLQTGFIAQDVEAAAQKLNYQFSGVDKPENPNGMYGLRYAEFVVPLLKAVQELDVKNKNLQLEIELLKQEHQLLLNRLTALEKK
jgi:trimeric autotransporter adhesin